MRDTGKPGAKPGAAGGKSRKKREKGGTRNFVTSLEEMKLRDEQEEEKRKARGVVTEQGSDADEDESSNEEGEELVAFERVQTKSLFGFHTTANGPTLQPETKKVGFAAVAKAQNPNSKKTANKVMKAKDMDANAAPQELSRREREALEKERSAAYYLKKHLAGETEEAKKDLARLAEVKRRRDEAEQRKKEEDAAAAERDMGKKKVTAKNDDEPLDARAIKALKPAVLKDKLKERDLSIQGQKKELVQRLIDYENERAL
ncbi:hypothetical protein CCR75_002248 [Bremia lactucae]|uniref:SAP domain-containing protein n=1 Tax=Bremia lactucae TaxID=4779 RepID=A0A976FPH6_BRELC|nr:hypothetical protein CCR75_002248 [Bremia lactucae]